MSVPSEQCCLLLRSKESYTSVLKSDVYRAGSGLRAEVP